MEQPSCLSIGGAAKFPFEVLNTYYGVAYSRVACQMGSQVPSQFVWGSRVPSQFMEGTEFPLNLCRLAELPMTELPANSFMGLGGFAGQSKG